MVPHGPRWGGVSGCGSVLLVPGKVRCEAGGLKNGGLGRQAAGSSSVYPRSLTPWGHLELWILTSQRHLPSLEPSSCPCCFPRRPLPSSPMGAEHVPTVPPWVLGPWPLGADGVRRLALLGLPAADEQHP